MTLNSVPFTPEDGMLFSMRLSCFLFLKVTSYKSLQLWRSHESNPPHHVFLRFQFLDSCPTPYVTLGTSWPVSTAKHCTSNVSSILAEFSGGFGEGITCTPRAMSCLHSFRVPQRSAPHAEVSTSAHTAPSWLSPLYPLYGPQGTSNLLLEHSTRVSLSTPNSVPRCGFQVNAMLSKRKMLSNKLSYICLMSLHFIY